VRYQQWPRSLTKHDAERLRNLLRSVRSPWALSCSCLAHFETGRVLFFSFTCTDEEGVVTRSRFSVCVDEAPAFHYAGLDNVWRAVCSDAAVGLDVARGTRHWEICE
jgi:hypothetical protein